jgi:hypothetical protein
MLWGVGLFFKKGWQEAKVQLLPQQQAELCV